MEKIDEKQMSIIIEKFNAFQADISKEFGVILMPDFVLKKVEKKETSIEKVEEVTETKE